MTVIPDEVLRHLTDGDAELLKDLILKSMTLEEISTKVNRSKQTLKKRLNRIGHKLHPFGASIRSILV